MLSSVRIATFRGVQEAARQRRGARVKEEELEVNVSIWIEEQLPDDHEIMGIAETRHVADQPKPNFNYCKISETLLRDDKVIAIGKITAIGDGENGGNGSDKAKAVSQGDL